MTGLYLQMDTTKLALTQQIWESILTRGGLIVYVRFSAPPSQFLNFVLMPLYMRTAFMGCCAFLWASFLCFSRQSGDGTAAVAVAFVMDPRKTLLEIREARLARKKDQNQRKN